MKIVLLILSICSLHASYVGNPSSPIILDQGGVITSDYCVNMRISYEGDFVIDAMLEKDKEGSGRVDHFYQDLHFGTVTLSFYDALDVYGSLGQGQIDADWRVSSPLLTSLIEICTDYGFAWSIGARGIIWQYCDLTLGIGGRYLQMDPKLSYLTSNGELQQTSSNICFKTAQADLCLSYRIDFFIPYIGIKYDSTWAKLTTPGVTIADNGQDILHFENRNPVGMVIGCTLSTGCQIMASIEARLFNEEAITISGSFRF